MTEANTNRLTCWAGGEGGCFSCLFPAGGSDIYSGVGHLMMVHCGSRVAFLVGLAGAKGSIDYRLHCSLGCRETDKVKNYISETDLYNVLRSCASRSSVHVI